MNFILGNYWVESECLTTTTLPFIGPLYDLIGTRRKLAHYRTVVENTHRDVMNLAYLCLMTVSYSSKSYVTRSEPAMTRQLLGQQDHTTMSTPTVQHCTGELQDQYENNPAHSGHRVLARFLNHLKIS